MLIEADGLKFTYSRVYLCRCDHLEAQYLIVGNDGMGGGLFLYILDDMCYND